MRREGLPGAIWPSDLQEDVLRAALLPLPEAVAAWRRLRAIIDFDDIWDAEIHRLLPLIYVHLQEASVDDPDLGRLKGLYRRTWYENQMGLHRVRPSIEALLDARVAVMALKGVPLALQYYGDLGRRPMSDIDILVPFDQARRALDLLETRGWRDAGRMSRTSLERRFHGSGMRHPEGGELDVHWVLGDEFVLRGDEARSSDPFWERSTELDVSGLALRTLDPTDTLMHVCVHGTWAGSSATVRWVADACTVLRVSRPDIDWVRLAADAHTYRLTLQLSAAFGYLTRRFGIDLPPGLLAELARGDTTWHERRLYEASMASIEGHRVLGGLPHTRAYWAHTRQRWSNARALREAPGFITDLWRLDSPTQIPIEAGRKAMRRLRPPP